MIVTCRACSLPLLRPVPDCAAATAGGGLPRFFCSGAPSARFPQLRPKATLLSPHMHITVAAVAVFIIGDAFQAAHTPTWSRGRRLPRRPPHGTTRTGASEHVQ